MSLQKIRESIQAGVHHQLSLMQGQWEGVTKVWFVENQIEDESPSSGIIRTVLDGRFLLHEYEGTFKGEPLKGMSIYGYNLNTNTFQSAWVDSFHMSTGIMFSEGRKNEAVFSVLGGYDVLEPHPQKWGWRTTLELKNSDTLIITAYNISPEGEEIKAVETVYNRKG